MSSCRVTFAAAEASAGPVTSSRSALSAHSASATPYRMGDRDIAILEGKSWGKRPVKVTVPELGSIQPGLLLFAAFVVRRLATNADSSTAGTTAAVTSSSSG